MKLADIPIGELRVTRWEDPATLTLKLRIDHADPRVWITDELLDQIRRGSPFARVDGQALTITGSNREVIYRIGTYDWRSDCHLLEWPD